MAPLLLLNTPTPSSSSFASLLPHLLPSLPYPPMATPLSLLRTPASVPCSALRPSSQACLPSDFTVSTSSAPPSCSVRCSALGLSLRRARPVSRPRFFKIQAVQVETSSDLYEEIQERLAALVKESPTLRMKAAKKLQDLAEELAKEEEVDEATAAAIMLHPLEKIKKGFALFKNEKYLKKPNLFEQLKTGQSPKLMVIACSDSRVCPTHVLGLEPGDAFVVRNVANLVPPWEEKGFPGTSAALEYAVLHLKVEHILVMGHSMCGGIKALMSLPDKESPKWSDFIEDWILIGKPARNRVKAACGSASLDEQCRHCETESVSLSLTNLLSFPWIKDRVVDGKLTLHGGYYDFIDGSFHHWTLDLKKSETAVLGRE